MCPTLLRSERAKRWSSSAATGSVATVTGRCHRGNARPSLGGAPIAERTELAISPSSAGLVLVWNDDLESARAMEGKANGADWHDTRATEMPGAETRAAPEERASHPSSTAPS